MSKFSRLFLIGLVVWCCAGGPAQTSAASPYTIAAPADWVKDRPIAPDTELPHVAGGQSFLLLDRQINVREDATYHRRAYQIVNETGREGGAQVYLSFDPSYEQLQIHHLRLTRSGETYDRLDPAKIQILQQERELDRLLYNGQRSALVILDDVRIGDTIDVAYTLRGRNPVFGKHFIDVAPFGWAVPVKAQYLRLLAPPGRNIRSQIQGDLHLTPARTTRDGLVKTEWSAHDLPAIEAEDNIPASTVVYPFIELSEFQSWHEVVQWALPLYAVESAVDPLVAAEARRIREQKLDAPATVVAALDFVQQEIRYLGIEMGPGSHQPSPPGEVIKRRFGDCKDKARLLTAILTELGIQASPMLVHSSRRDNLHQWLPSPYAFDHVIVAVNLGHLRWILDPTLTYQRGATPNLRHVGRYGPGLDIRAGTESLEDITRGPADSYHSVIREDFTLPGFDQPAAFTVTTAAHGASANSLRAYFANRSREQLSREYLEYYTHYHAGISSAAPVEIDDDTRANVIHVTEHYSINDLFRRTGTDGTLLAEFYPSAVDGYMRTPNLSRRRHPYALSYPVDIESQTHVTLPEDWPTVDSSELVEADAFAFKQAVRGQGRNLTLTYHWHAKTDQVGLDRITGFAGKINQARALLGYQLSYNPTLAGKNGITLNWFMVLHTGVVLLLSGAGAVMLIRRRNPAPMPPPLLEPAPADPYAFGKRRQRDDLNGLGGWLILVIIGLILRPVYLLGLLTSGSRAYYDIHLWRALTSPGSPAYQPDYVWAAPFELALNLALLVFNVALIVLFFRRSFLFPRAFQVLLGASVAVSIYGVVSMQLFHGLAAEDQMEAWRSLFQTIVAAAIWIPYFSVSRRVKRTFVR